MHVKHTEHHEMYVSTRYNCSRCSTYINDTTMHIYTGYLLAIGTIHIRNKEVYFEYKNMCGAYGPEGHRCLYLPIDRYFQYLIAVNHFHHHILSSRFTYGHRNYTDNSVSAIHNVDISTHPHTHTHTYTHTKTHTLRHKTHCMLFREAYHTFVSTIINMLTLTQ